ncbi:MAG: ureidoglycolate lyase [Acuticoccus sp.]
MTAAPLTAEAFAPYGEVIAAEGAPTTMINEGRCGRHHDLAALDFADGRAGISLFDSQCVAMPYRLRVMERHPQGSQAFLPIGAARCLLVVAGDGAAPAAPVAFISAAGQGFNVRRNVWHAPLAPLEGGRFFVVDRIGEGANLELAEFDPPLLVI